MVSNKRGRKVCTDRNHVDRYVKTFAKFDGEWIFQGISKKRVVGVENIGAFDYYTLNGIEMKQEH